MQIRHGRKKRQSASSVDGDFRALQYGIGCNLAIVIAD